jgi:hypothetical protein
MQQLLYWRIRISVRYAGPHLSTVLRVSAPTDRQSFPAYDRRISELMSYVAYKQQRDPRLAPEQQPPYLSSSTDCALSAVRSLMFVLRLISSAVARLKMLFTACHGSAAPTGPGDSHVSPYPKECFGQYVMCRHLKANDCSYTTALF